MPSSPLLMLHICAAIVGLLSGFAAMIFRKGSNWHGAAGTVFFVSMLAMSSSAAYIALVHRPNKLNVIAGLLTFYLVATAWRAGRNRAGLIAAPDKIAFAFILFVGITGIAYGFQAASSPRGTKDGMPAAIYFIFGTVALLCATNDLRMLRRGSLTGAKRIARHLWRMCLALLIATLSFFPGQGRLFPKWLKATNLLYIPHVLLIGSMLFWLYRVSVRKRTPRSVIVDAPRAEAMLATGVTAQ
jgi:uncharacterized membrane protein